MCSDSDADPATRRSEVVICDSHTPRSELIKRIAAECGAHSRQCADLLAVGQITPSLQSSCALVALDQCPASDSPVLDAVRALAATGIFVVCYADGAQKWPLVKRCNVLLAGTLTFFDSGNARFAFELKQTIRELLHCGRLKVEEQERIKREMKSVGIVGESKAILEIFGWIKRVGPLSDLSALICGETGTGKELIVNAIYRLDPKRSHGPLIVLNCGAIGAGIAESEFFGHSRGAFTGAYRQRTGLIRSAHGGILFLDEVGDLDVALQAKLLRVLQEHRVLSVGADREVPIDIRIIAATNRNIEEMVRQGTFRADLFHRLNILSIQVPSLRQRPADLMPLVQHFLEKHGHLSSVKNVTADPEFIEALAQLNLPGNVREVENLVRRALVNKTTGSPLMLSDLPPEALGEIARDETEATSDNGRSTISNLQSTALSDNADCLAALPKLLLKNDGNLVQTLEQCERALVALALHDCNGNRSLVAKQLGITPRSVYNKLRKYHLG